MDDSIDTEEMGFGPVRVPVMMRKSIADRLAVYKIPARIEAVSLLPRTASGKLIRDEERMLQAAELAV
jgi:acyl-coenzyme A synthetase/AMP-(fatty) acid ligase